MRRYAWTLIQYEDILATPLLTFTIVIKYQLYTIHEPI